MTQTRKTVVHLVHGTWPFGPFKKSSTGNSAAWFEHGSSVRANIEKLVGLPVQFEEFVWSGENSFTAREIASYEFEAYLAMAATKYPREAHIIVAHSHGGTVVTRALSRSAKDQKAGPEITSFICLATPFIYLSKGDLLHRYLTCSATGSVLMALSIVLCIQFWNGLAAIHFGGILVAGIAVWLALTLGIGAWTSASPLVDEQEDQPIPSGIPVFLFRATRDEAALVLGLTQTVHSVAFRLFKIFEDGPVVKTKWRAVRYALLSNLFLIFGIGVFRVASTGLPADVFSVEQLLTFSFLLASGLAGLFYIGGYGLVALAVGFFDLRLWPRFVVEVDAAPLGKACIFKSYSVLDSIDTESLRHGIYDLPDTQRDIASIISRVGLGDTNRGVGGKTTERVYVD